MAECLASRPSWRAITRSSFADGAACGAVEGARALRARARLRRAVEPLAFSRRCCWGSRRRTPVEFDRVSLTGKRIFMTGGAGFIGTSLARRLVEDNEIVILDNLHRDSLTGTDLAEHKNLRFVQGDVLDLPRVRELA